MDDTPPPPPEGAVAAPITPETGAQETVGPPVTPNTGPPKEPPQREPVRAALAISLVAIFGIEVIASIIYLFVACDDLSGRVEALKEFAQIFLGPTVALVGAGTGFYFGRGGSSS
jgi:hypothetical protein